MEKIKHILREYGMDLLMGIGAGAITVGAALIYPPAGWIVGGILLIVGAALNSLGGSEKDL